ncbi:hypothetical protein Barb7_03129 [Bacteroidales bacterium Barb7]|nr:hypothetical protein Barb7_03129 [Bacteroidales bacterium Barb7]
MVSNTVSSSFSSCAWFWAKYPIFTLCPSCSLPVKPISSMMHFTSVDFPSPFFPTKATLSLRLMVKVTCPNIRCSP